MKGTPGRDIKKFWKGLARGKKGVDNISHFHAYTFLCVPKWDTDDRVCDEAADKGVADVKKGKNDSHIVIMKLFAIPKTIRENT